MAEPLSLDARDDEPSPVAVAPASLFSAVRVSIGSELPRYAARYLGENEVSVGTAMDLLILACLRRFAFQIATTEGAARLFGDLADRRLDTQLSAALERLLADPPGEREQPVPGERAMARVTVRHFGRSARSVVRTAASATGLGVETVWRLLVLTTPHVLAALRDYMRAGSLDAKALRERLENEYPSATRQHPLRQAFAGWRPDYRRALALAALVVALAAAIALAWRSTVAPPGSPERAEGSGVPPQPRPENEAPPRAIRSAEASALIEFLSNDTAQREYVFALDGVQFEPATATLRSTSNAQLKELAATLVAFPEAKIRLEAHAAGDTEAERALAEQRAVAVRAALAVFGVALARTDHTRAGDTIGRGDRVEARVTRQ